MNRHKNTEVMQLRAHHICCLPFARWQLGERGSGFQQVETKIKSALRSQSEMAIRVTEGVDELCHQCPYYVDERCTSPLGNEDEVRKWDAILLKELGLPFGTCLTSSEWQALIEQKVPFKLCQKCQWNQECSLGEKLL